MITIASVSGGLSSAEMLRRCIEQYGRDNVLPVFADIKGDARTHHWAKFPIIDQLEHERFGGEARDLYRFLWQLSHALDMPILRLEQSETIYAHMARNRAFLISNPSGANFAPCSLFGKRERIARFLESIFAPGTYRMALGFDFAEIARVKNARYWWSRRLGFDIEIVCPLAEKPYVDNEVISQQLSDMGIEIPEAYDYGYGHNNCNGGCVESGIRQWVLTHKVKPDVYAYWMRQERALQDYGINATIARDQRKDHDPQLSLEKIDRMIRDGSAPSSWTTKAREQVAGCACFTKAMPLLAEVPLIVTERRHSAITKTEY